MQKSSKQKRRPKWFLNEAEKEQKREKEMTKNLHIVSGKKAEPSRKWAKRTQREGKKMFKEIKKD